MEETPRRWQARWRSNIVVEVLLMSRNTSLTILRMLNGNQLKNSGYFLNCETEETVQNLTQNTSDMMSRITVVLFIFLFCGRFKFKRRFWNSLLVSFSPRMMYITFRKK